jgi:hypothetical protein
VGERTNIFDAELLNERRFGDSGYLFGDFGVDHFLEFMGFVQRQEQSSNERVEPPSLQVFARGMKLLDKLDNMICFEL